MVLVMGTYLLSAWLSLSLLAVFFGIMLLVFTIYDFSIIFLLLLVLRSSLDVFTNTGLIFANFNFNVPAVLSIYIVAGGCIYLLNNKYSVFPLISIYYGLWLLILVPFVGLNLYNFDLNGAIAVRELTRLLTILMVFLVTYNMVNTDNINKFLSAIMLSLIVPLGVGYFQLSTKTGMVINGIHRIYGTIVHPNSYALFIVLFLGLTYWKWRRNFGKIWGLLLLLELGALFSTVSFNGMIMFFLLLSIILWQENFYYKISLVLVILIFILLLSQNKQVQQRFEEIEGTNFKHNIQHLELGDSISWRLGTWWQLIKLWREEPFIGYGLQATNIINPIIMPNGEPAEAHNDYLKYLLETGIVGFSLYVLFNILVAATIFWEYRMARNSQLERLLFILFAVFISWQIGSLSSNFLRATAFQFYFWATLGVALKCRRLEKVHQLPL